MLNRQGRPSSAGEAGTNTHPTFTGNKALDFQEATEVSCNLWYALAGLDTGSPFGGMGSSREMTVVALTEPTVALSIFALALVVPSAGPASAWTDSLELPPSLLGLKDAPPADPCNKVLELRQPATIHIEGGTRDEAGVVGTAASPRFVIKVNDVE